jgi:hypothetical protein
MSAMDYSLTLTAVSPAICGAATFPASHAAFDGHFPERPILPAFMQIQVALDLLERASRGAVLARIEDAKFLRPVAPGEPIFIELSPTGPLTYVAVLTVRGERASHFILTVSGPSAPQESAAPRVDLR